MYQKVNLYPYPYEIKEWIAANLGWNGTFTVVRNKSSGYELGEVFGKGKRHAPGSIPLNVAQAIVNAAQASIPTMKGTQQYFDKPAVDAVTFDLVEPTMIDGIAVDPRYYAPTEAGRQQYLRDYGTYLKKNRQAHDDEQALGRAPDLRYFSK